MKINILSPDLGDLVKDRITGFTGVAVARTTWINGCVRWTVQPAKLSKDGTVKATECFDGEQVQVLRKSAVPSYGRVVVAGTLPPGGPRPSPSRPSSPKRF